jgi:glycosyltransferase involved in cell wall biosynthesis
LPMVCLKGDGIETVLENGGGIAVGFDSFDDIGQNLANAISTLYNDEELRVKLAKEAQNIVARDFNYKVLADEIMVVYKQALENCNEQ